MRAGAERDRCASGLNRTRSGRSYLLGGTELEGEGAHALPVDVVVEGDQVASLVLRAFRERVCRRKDASAFARTPRKAAARPGRVTRG